jgi:phospholipid/cholesterol/gamma-HCH transport system substrate-binding protein
MNEAKLAGKVGFFVTIGIVVTVLLLLSFTKGLNLFTRTYELRLRTPSVAGLKERASVLMAGVPIGTVAGADVAPDGRGVIIRLRVQERYRIHSDARFAIEQIGFLGDQYVAIYPQANAGTVLSAGAEVESEQPFNVQEIARSTAGLLQRLDSTVQTLDRAFARVDRTLLQEEALTNLAAAFGNLREVSEKAATLVDNVDGFVRTNSAPLSASVSNLLNFSSELDQVAAELRLAVSTNRDGVTAAVKNFQAASGTLSNLVRDLNSGKGLAGGLLKDEELRRNVLEVSENLVTLTSNLSRYGLLYKPKRPKTESARKTPTYPGRNPFR